MVYIYAFILFLLSSLVTLCYFIYFKLCSILRYLIKNLNKGDQKND